MPKKKRKKVAKKQPKRQKRSEEITDKELDDVSGGTQAYLDAVGLNVRLPPKRRDVDR